MSSVHDLQKINRPFSWWFLLYELSFWRVVLSLNIFVIINFIFLGISRFFGFFVFAFIVNFDWLYEVMNFLRDTFYFFNILFIWVLFFLRFLEFGQFRLLHGVFVFKKLYFLFQLLNQHLIVLISLHLNVLQFMQVVNFFTLVVYFINFYT